MSTTARPMTVEELWAMPDRPRCELVEGELRIMSPAGGAHGYYAIRLASALERYVEEHRLGVVVGCDAGFIIGRDPDTVRAPNVAFVARDRIPPDGIPEAFWPGAPDLAVEVVSPGDKPKEVEDKVRDWLAAGCRMVWVVRPRRRTVTVHRGEVAPIVLSGDDLLDGEDVVPGFRHPVGSLFEY